MLIWFQYFFTLSFIPHLYFTALEPKFPSELTYVHIVPHTHNDVGWRATIQTYYDFVSTNSVKNILDQVVEALSKNSKRRFGHVEQLFFQKWWE